MENNARSYVAMTIRGKLYEERIRWGVLLKLRRDLEKRKCKNDECRSIVTRICSTCNSPRKEAADSLPRRFPREATHGSMRHLRNTGFWFHCLQFLVSGDCSAFSHQCGIQPEYWASTLAADVPSCSRHRAACSWDAWSRDEQLASTC